MPVNWNTDQGDTLLDKHGLFGISKPSGSTEMFSPAEVVVSDIHIFWQEIYDKLESNWRNDLTP